MTTAIRRRRGTTAQHSTFIGLDGETTIDTDKEVVVVHDGTTQGGFPLMRENGSNSALALGSAATPSLKFTGDTNTGIYSPGADQVAISTGGSGRLFVSSTGNIGVNNSSPSALLHVQSLGSAAQIRLESTDNTNGQLLVKNTAAPNGFIVGLLGDTTGNAAIYHGDNKNILFYTNASERLRITSAGLVGVGTSSPTEILNVVGGNIKVDSATRRIGYWEATNVNDGYIVPYNASGEIEVVNSFVNGGIVFKTGTSKAERARIDSSGRVGIGTSSPGVLFETRTDTASTTNELIRLRNDGAGYNAGTKLSFWNISEKASLASYYSSTGGDGWKFAVSNNGSTRLLIDQSGNVGIGTNAPQKLLHLSTSDNVPLYVQTTNANCYLQLQNNTGLYYIKTTGNNLAFESSLGEVGRWDGSGRLLVGTSSVISNNFGGTAGLLQVAKNDYLPIGFFTYNNNAGETGYCPYVELNRARGTQASPTVVGSGDDLGLINFYGHDGTNFTRAATIKAVVDGTPGAGDMPGRLVFSTTADGASSPTERMRITSGGYLKQSPTGSYNGNTALYNEFNANNADSYVVVTRCTNASPASEYIQDFRFSAATPNNTSARFWNCMDATAERAYMASNGGLYNYSANNSNLSDRNAKKDISPAADTWNCIKEWEIVNYRYKDQPDDADLNLGVIAQQVAESCPEVVTVFQEAKEATEDQPAQEERLGIKEQQMYWMAIKALQEAQVRIEALEAEVAALKAQ